MTLVDRFICRREGHVPAFTLTWTSGVTAGPAVTSCQRCGKTFEVKQAAADRSSEAVSPDGERSA